MIKVVVNEIFLIGRDGAVVDLVMRHLTVLLDNLRVGNGVARLDDTRIIVGTLSARAGTGLSGDGDLLIFALLVPSSIVPL